MTRRKGGTPPVDGIIPSWEPWLTTAAAIVSLAAVWLAAHLFLTDTPTTVAPSGPSSVPTGRDASRADRGLDRVAVPTVAARHRHPSPTPTAEPVSTPSVDGEAGSVVGSLWAALAECESGGDWSINTGNGFYGGLQFSLSSWRGVGGTGYPHEASPAEQIMRAERLLAVQGWGAWPACSTELGLR